MIDSVPATAPASPPLTGASSTRRPASAPVRASSRAVSGRIVEKSINRPAVVPPPVVSPDVVSPTGRAATISAKTSDTCGESGSIVTITSAPRTASATLAALAPPAATSRSMADCL
jgi:hypothetical protein